MNGKQIHGYGVLVILLIISLTAFACGGPGDGDGQDETTQSSAVGSTEPSGSGSSAVTGGQTTTSQSSGEQTTVPAGSTTTAATSGGDLTSYRIHTTWRDGSREGSIKDEWTTEFVADPLAVHHKAAGDMDMEMIFVGKTMWTRFMDLPWQKAELPEGETADWASMLSEAESLVDVEEQTPVEDGIQWLMGQPEVKIVEGSLTLAGEETVNGVTCKRYTVDSTYTYNVEYQALSAKATITEGTQGEIWVADQEGWSPFVVRAQLLQTTTTQLEGGPSVAETVYIEEDVTDINSSDIVVEPPQ